MWAPYGQKGAQEFKPGLPSRKRSMKDAVITVCALKELDVTTQFWLEHAGSPIHSFVAR